MNRPLDGRFLLLSNTFYREACPQAITADTLLPAHAHPTTRPWPSTLPVARKSPPWKLALRYDELTTLRLIRPTAPLAGQAWDESFRASLNLMPYIDFRPLA
ncbi:hypothetical protein [Hymenobacter cheonanensis]|uniref:hypothetical protein n=1 Tax=Hymenobacter sp. CA2-7 TaxID=3063993 RepID=UPI0027141379|nr:hypothetical protein [Hymenobacter sp. CA2-7]MDO7884337.1 hypothetical protein [Hymenobacter sp. CA2-7]